MTDKAKYFEVLSGAIAQLEEDTFEARQHVYDRLWAIILRQLQQEGRDFEDELANERAAFLAAVSKIEFGKPAAAAPSIRADWTVNAPEAALREVPEARIREVPESPFRELPEASFREIPEGSRREPPETALREKSVPKRSGARRIAARLAFGCGALVALWFAYLVVFVRFDSASAERWVGEHVPNSLRAPLIRAALSFGNLLEGRQLIVSGPSQRAVLYAEDSKTATGATFSGQAVWRHEAGPASARASGAILAIDAEIPQKQLFVRISIRRAPDGGGAISHFVEFRFLNPDGSASDLVEDVLGILMKNDELSRGIELVGKVVRVQRGAFLMGLSATESDLGRNLKLLKERHWLDIPIVMKDKTRTILAIEKGQTGQSALNDALASWGQT